MPQRRAVASVVATRALPGDYGDQPHLCSMNPDKPNLLEIRRLCSDWAYWCHYGSPGERGGRKPSLHTGGIEKRYRAPPQWHPPAPRMPEANENVGLAVQRAYIRLPQSPYRNIIRAEFCIRPWVIALSTNELNQILARKARISSGAYQITLDRALLALASTMRRMGTLQKCSM